MDLIITDETCAFNKEKIKKGFAIWAKHATWDEGITGFVKVASSSSIVVIFPPGINNVVNHFLIDAKEVAAGEWTIRYSENLKEVNTYPEEGA